MPIYAGPAQAPLLRELVEARVPESVNLVVDQPTGFALWGLDPLPNPALVVTFNEHPLYLLDLFARRAQGVLVAPKSLTEVRSALEMAARGRRIGRPPTLAFDAPSARERQVLRLLAQGLCSREIAEHLGVKRDTVYTYLQALREKLGADSQHELALTYLGHIRRRPTE
jgi:DNA-binding NarL/FixJ family response regulator